MDFNPLFILLVSDVPLLSEKNGFRLNWYGFVDRVIVTIVSG